MPVPICSVEVFNKERVPSEPFNNTSSQRPQGKPTMMPILSTSEKVTEGDSLLKKSSQKVEEFRGTLGKESYEMAQEWLEM